MGADVTKRRWPYGVYVYGDIVKEWTCITRRRLTSRMNLRSLSNLLTVGVLPRGATLVPRWACLFTRHRLSPSIPFVDTDQGLTSAHYTNLLTLTHHGVYTECRLHMLTG
jgi:hypothetical protein